MRLTLSMASYGRPQRTIRAINSIANQNINGWEALVIGDGCPVMQDYIDSNYFKDLIDVCSNNGNDLYIANNPVNQGGNGYAIINNNIKDEWIKADITVVFNPKGIADIVFYYPNGITKRFHQINNPKKDKTTNGDEYQIVQCLNESGEEMAIQLFDDDTCLRVIVAEGYYVEFHKD